MKKISFFFMMLFLLTSFSISANELNYSLRGGVNLDVTSNFRYTSADVDIDLVFDNIPGLTKVMNYGKITFKPYIGVQIFPAAYRLDDEHRFEAYGLSPKLYTEFSKKWSKSWETWENSNFVWAIFEGAYAGVSIEYDITEKMKNYSSATVFVGYDRSLTGSSSSIKIGLRTQKDSKEKTYGFGLNNLSNAYRFFTKIGITE